MGNRRDYFFRQKVLESELDAGFADAEDADRAIMSDQSLIGIFDEGIVSETLTPGLTVDISGPCLAYDQTGQRIFFSPTQNLNMAVDEFGNPTTVATPGNAKILSIFIEFDRLHDAAHEHLGSIVEPDTAVIDDLELGLSELGLTWELH